MPPSSFSDKLTSLCERIFSGEGEVNEFKRLTGGASMESWLFKYQDQDYVMRRLPEGVKDLEIEGRIPLASEIAVIRAANLAGVKAPEILGELLPSDDLGSGFIMECAKGEALPYRIFKDAYFARAVPKLTQSCAEQLAKIHAIDLQNLSALTHHSPQERLAMLEAEYRSYGKTIPVFELAFHRLENSIPESSDTVLLHGDFRMGNILVDAKDITAVLDWELASIGDPAQDLGYLCTPSWRFGQYDKKVGGFGDVDILLSAYEASSGRKIDKSALKFWMIYSSLWWGVCCLGMISLWRNGVEKTLERTVIGRRVSEVEADILLLLEEMNAIQFQPLNWDFPKTSPAFGDSEDYEIQEALISWIESSVIPNTEGRELFQARVAKNALGIVSRSAQFGPGFNKAQHNRLAKLELTHQALCSGLRSGALSLNTQGITPHLRLSTLERLSVDQPKYAGLHAALMKWKQ